MQALQNSEKGFLCEWCSYYWRAWAAKQMPFILAIQLQFHQQVG